MNMIKFGRSGLFWFTFFAVATYIVLWAVFPLSMLIDLINGLFFGVCISVLMVLIPLVGRAIVTPTFDRVSQLTMGMFIVWIAVTTMRAFSVFRRATEQTNLVNSPVISAASWMAIIGGLLYISAPGMVGPELKHNKFFLCLVMVVGIMFAIVTFIFETR